MNDKSKQDNLFASPLGNVPRFAFDQAVVDVFPDMIQRSVPGYQTIINLCGELAARYVRPGSNCYDLGCSLGGLVSGNCSAGQAARCQHSRSG